MLIIDPNHNNSEVELEACRPDSINKDYLQNSVDTFSSTKGSDDELPRDQTLEKDCGNERKYKCEICDRIFSRKNNMKRHVMMKHTGEKPHNCPQCDKKFSLKSTLQIHIRLHTGEKPFECETCHKTFRQRPSYITHLKTHTGDRRHVCSICGYLFLQKGHLKYHMKTHSDVKEFSCQICNKRFSHIYSLKRHALTHRDDKERKIYACNICEKRFCSSQTLDFHLKAHAGIKEFECKKCGKAFQGRSSLNRHLKRQEFAKIASCDSPRGSFRKVMYECNFCLQKFKKKYMLRTHIYSHTGERPFQCKECNMGFTVKSSLKVHLRMYCKGKESVQEKNDKCKSKSASSVFSELSDKSTSLSESSNSEELISTSIKASLKQDLIRLDPFQAKLNSNSSNAMEETSKIVGIENMSKHLTISRDNETPGMQSALSTEHSDFLRSLPNEKEVISANKASQKDNRFIFMESTVGGYNCKHETDVIEDIKQEIDVIEDIKQEIEIVDEDIDGICTF